MNQSPTKDPKEANMKNWYVIRSKPRKESALLGEMRARGFDVYCPMLKVNPVNPRSRKIKPYFPGYLFLHVDMDEIGTSTLQWMPHSQGLVSFGGVPPTVPESLINAVRNHLAKVNAAGGEDLFDIHPGDVVRIKSGPFRGYEAIFDTRLKGDERARVFLSLLENSRQIPLEVDVNAIKRSES